MELLQPILTILVSVAVAIIIAELHERHQLRREQRARAAQIEENRRRAEAYKERRKAEAIATFGPRVYWDAKTKLYLPMPKENA